MNQCPQCNRIIHDDLPCSYCANQAMETPGLYSKIDKISVHLARPEASPELSQLKSKFAHIRLMLGKAAAEIKSEFHKHLETFESKLKSGDIPQDPQDEALKRLRDEHKKTFEKFDERQRYLYQDVETKLTIVKKETDRILVELDARSGEATDKIRKYLKAEIEALEVKTSHEQSELNQALSEAKLMMSRQGETLGRLSSELDAQIDRNHQEITKKIHEKSEEAHARQGSFFSTLEGGVVIVFVLAVVSLGGIYWHATTTINEDVAGSIEKSVSVKLADDAMKAMVATTVQREAETAAQKQVNAELTMMKEKVSGEMEKLASEVELLKQRNLIQGLEDQAIKMGDRLAYEQLRQIQRTFYRREIVHAAMASILRVKSFYERNLGIPQDVLSLGTRSVEIEESSVEAQVLINYLQTHPDPLMRSDAARKLSKTTEYETPEALIEAAKNETNLFVLKESLAAFSEVTGYRNPDLFGYEYAAMWWRANRSDFIKKSAT